MSIFDDIKGKKDTYLKVGKWKLLRQGLYSSFDYQRDRYMLKKNGVVNYLTEEDCKAIVEDLTGGIDEESK